MGVSYGAGMKRVPRYWLLSVLISSVAFGASSDEAAVRSADERRIQATISGRAEDLRELLSDELVYAQADGRVQTKAQLVAALPSSQLKYLSVEPSEEVFQSIAPHAATLSGRARLVVDASGRKLSFTLRFLAVWREESGHWRLLAYQSAQLEAPH